VFLFEKINGGYVMNQKLSLSLTDILVTVVIALIFAVIYYVWDGVYTILQLFVLHLDEIVYGMWFMAAILEYLMMTKNGVALICEFATAFCETIVLLQFDISLIIYGIVQGLVCEIVFMLFRYNNTKVYTAIIAGVVAAVSTLPLDWYYGYLGQVETWNL